MRDETTLALRPDLFGQLAATDPFQGRARRLYERGQVLVVNGNQADVRVGYDARNNPLDLKEVPIVSGYIPRVGDWVAIQYEAGHSGAPWVAGPSMAADESEDTPGIGVFSVSSEEPTDPPKSTVYFHEPASTWRGWNGAAWVDLGGGGGGLHNSLPDLQGGAAGQYYHLTAAQWNALTGNIPFGAGGVVYADASGALKTDAANLYWHATNKWLGIGTPAPTERLHILDGLFLMQYQDGEPAIEMQGFGDVGSTSYPLIRFRRARGTIAVPTAVKTDDRLGYPLMVYGHDGAGWQTAIFSRVDATEDWGANRGAVQRFWQNYTGAAAATEWMQWREGQIRIQNGSAALPSFSFLNYPTMGFFAAANNLVALEVGGLRVSNGCISTQGYQGTPTGTGPGAELRYYSGSGRVSLLGYNRGGAAFIPVEVSASAFYVNLSGNDRASLTGNGVLWLYPHDPNLTADGQAAMDSVHKTYRWYMGGMQQLGAALVDDALVTTVSVPDVGGVLAETTLSTKTLKSAFSVSGNTYKVIARGTACANNAKAYGGGMTLYIRFYLEGTLYFQLSLLPPMTESHWLWYEFSFDATLRSSTSWMISSLIARYKTWVGAPPWPTSVTTGMSQIDLLRDAPIVVSGDVVNEVKGYIANGNPGLSYVKIFDHKHGLELV